MDKSPSMAASDCRSTPLNWLCFGEFPIAGENFGTRPVEAHQVVPASDWKTVRDFAVAIAELHGHRTSRIFLR
jgi:hypothetical protein